MMNTDLELYRVFCEVVKYKNISKTAESMYISQSAITMSMGWRGPSRPLATR